MSRAYIALGANLGDRERTIRLALERLDAHPQISVERVSSLRETDPVGYEDQPRFLNGAALVETDLGPRDLLTVLLDLERDLGRTRHGPRLGPRPIDLDLLLYDDRVLDEPGLTVPHPRMGERLFVLDPLLELDPALEAPGLGRLQALRSALQ
jgi:2-amino-4-hydroxy-6-hydroxymethyldihydropteridine diphosphokinase